MGVWGFNGQGSLDGQESVGGREESERGNDTQHRATASESNPSRRNLAHCLVAAGTLTRLASLILLFFSIQFDLFLLHTSTRCPWSLILKCF